MTALPWFVKNYLDGFAIRCGQGGKHLCNAEPDTRMAPAWCDVGQRYQHKSAVLKPGMRQNQLIGFPLHLLIERQGAPSILNDFVRKNLPCNCQQVEINATCAPTPIVPAPAQTRFDGMQFGQQCLGFKLGFQRCAGVYIVGTAARREGRGFIKS